VKSSPRDFALLGGNRAFADDIHVGQLYFPEWERYERAMRSILDRQYYTNHGPLVRRLEERIESLLGVRNAVTVTNATLGLYLVALGLELRGKVMVPSFTFVGTAQAVLLAGLDAVLCDVDRETHHLTVAGVERALEDGVSALCPVGLWGGSADVDALSSFARAHGLACYIDSAQSFGSVRAGAGLGRGGEAEVFSFHATKVLSAAEGGCVCTDDDELAERIRNMRSNYGIRGRRPVSLTVNARMSEAQAAIGLLSLDDLDRRIAHNHAVFNTYAQALHDLPGIRLVQPSGVSASNFQSVVLEVDRVAFGMSRDMLWSVLRAEGVRARRYFQPGVHRSAPFDNRYPQYRDSLPVTDELCATLLQLPVGELCDRSDAERVADLVRGAHIHAGALLSRAG
jgi:dTDP-4-amino-4,6-dideoxygalactose transaminase